jgi:hypothetical protein
MYKSGSTEWLPVKNTARDGKIIGKAIPIKDHAKKTYGGMLV